MKNIFKFVAILAVSAVALTSCIKEVFPQGGSATSEQIGASASALEASVNGMPAQMSQGYLVYGDQVHETDMAFPQFMIAFTELTGDMFPLGADPGFDWYVNYNWFVRPFGETTYFAYLPWFTCYQFIKSANDVIASVDINSKDTTPAMLGYAGIAYASRAFDYYLLTVMFEPKANIYTDCSKVLGLTVPIVDENTDAEKAKKNPRVSHDDMIKFMLSDLTNAEKCFENFKPSSNLFPSLAVAYGIKAKVYMWDEDYANAAKYARLAIDTWGGTPVTESQWLDVNTGFNTSNQAWMWKSHYAAEMMGNLCNFTGWMSSEANWGYSPYSKPSIDKALYDSIADNDFRKYSFLDPAKMDFYPYKTCHNEKWIEDAPAYLSIKFRCFNQDCDNYAVGGAVDVPIMRVEEMYLIEAEAVGMSKNVADGVALLNEFMQNYRQKDYSFSAATARDLQLEVYKQERIEFWGEGWAFPNGKRIQPDVVQNYTGTNAPADNFKINCKGIKPNWNFCIPIFEIQANSALEGMNNPDPTGTIKTRPVPIGTFAPANF